MTSRANAVTAAVVLAVVLALAVGQSGCAITGSYEPKPSRRIAALDPSGRVYVREGRRYNLGFVGSAEDLVRGNDQAIAEARAYRQKMIAGWTLWWTGASMLAAGIIVHATRPDTLADTALIVGSFVPLLVSAPFLAGGVTSRQNAVNIYNDSLEGPIDPNAF